MTPQFSCFLGFWVRTVYVFDIWETDGGIFISRIQSRISPLRAGGHGRGDADSRRQEVDDRETSLFLKRRLVPHSVVTRTRTQWRLEASVRNV